MSLCNVCENCFLVFYNFLSTRFSIVFIENLEPFINIPLGHAFKNRLSTSIVLENCTSHQIYQILKNTGIFINAMSATPLENP